MVSPSRAGKPGSHSTSSSLRGTGPTFSKQEQTALTSIGKEEGRERGRERKPTVATKSVLPRHSFLFLLRDPHRGLAGSFQSTWHFLVLSHIQSHLALLPGA